MTGYHLAQFNIARARTPTDDQAMVDARKKVEIEIIAKRQG